MSNFSCKTLDYVNPNDVGGGRRESTECVLVAAARDQLQSRSRYVQQGWAALLSAQHCLERRWCRAVRETQNQIKTTYRQGKQHPLLPVSLTACCVQAHLPPLAGKPAPGLCGVGSLWGKRWRHRKGGWICVTTHKVHPSRVGRDLTAVSVRHSSM